MNRSGETMIKICVECRKSFITERRSKTCSEKCSLAHRKASKKTYMKEYLQTSEAKANLKAYRQTSKYKACRKAYNQTPEQKAYRKAYIKTYMKTYRQNSKPKDEKF